jgi:hypothetical protein
MILDMIQGCRYLRRSIDRWALSKNSTTRLEDSKVWRKAGLLWKCANTITYIQGSYLYPVVARLLVDYEHNIWYLNYRPNANAYPSIRRFRSGHVTMRSREISANSSLAERKQNCRPRASLPNLFKETFLLWTGFFIKLGPQIRPPSVPNFGVNICPFNYGIKVILFWNWLQLPTSSSRICSTPILSPRTPSKSPSRSKS